MRRDQNRVQVAGSGNFDACNAFDFAEAVGNFLRDHARRFFQALGQLEADGRSGFAHFDFGRAIETTSIVRRVSAPGCGARGRREGDL